MSLRPFALGPLRSPSREAASTAHSRAISRLRATSMSSPATSLPPLPSSRTSSSPRPPPLLLLLRPPYSFSTIFHSSISLPLSTSLFQSFTPLLFSSRLPKTEKLRHSPPRRAFLVCSRERSLQMEHTRKKRRSTRPQTLGRWTVARRERERERQRERPTE